MLYEALDVWRRAGRGVLVRYRCFRLLPSGGFCVQSADHYHDPADAARARQGEVQFLELLREEAPEERSEVYQTLDEAIRAFDDEFRDTHP